MELRSLNPEPLRDSRKSIPIQRYPKFNISLKIMVLFSFASEFKSFVGTINVIKLSSCIWWALSGTQGAESESVESYTKLSFNPTISNI